MRNPENVVFAAVKLLPVDQSSIVMQRWGLAGLTPCADVDEAAARLGVPRLLARRSYARAVMNLRTSDVTRKAFEAFEQRRAA